MDDVAGRTPDQESLMGDEHVLIQDYAVQFFPIWLAIPILLAVVFSLWMLAKIVSTAISS